MNPIQPQQLDQDVVNLAKAIRKVESNDNPQARGKSGEFGYYQYTPDTWASSTKKYLGQDIPLEQSTPEQQNEVTYKRLKEWKDAGYNVGQIASMWNAGEGKPEAYMQGHTGVNDKGVAYDTPAYAKKVAETYHTIKGSGIPKETETVTQTVATPQAKETVKESVQIPFAAKQTNVEPEEDKDTNILGKVLEFAFPILEKKERTPLQTIGDIGLSALWFVPGLGAPVSAALRTAGLGAKAARTVGLIGAGAATGYGADVATKLSEGETGADVLKPGLGTAISAGTAGVAGRLANKFSQKGVVEGIAKDNNAVFGQTKRGARELSESFSKNKNPGLLASEKGVNLKQMIDPETVAYDTLETSQKIRNDARTLNEVLTDALARVGGSKPVEEIETALLRKVPKNAPERADIIRKEMALLRQQYGGAPSIADLNEWKQRAWDLSRFDMAVPNETRKTYRMIGNTLKEDVEKLAKAGGLPDVGEMNEYIGSHLDLVDMLDLLHGTKGKGGRLGDMLRQRTLETIGGAGGAVVGGGLPGLVLGGLTGHFSAPILSKILRGVEGSPLKSAILRRMVKEDPEVVKKVLQFSKRTPEELKALQRQLGEQGIDIFKSGERNIVAPKLAPNAKERAPLIQGLLTTGAARAGAQ